MESSVSRTLQRVEVTFANVSESVRYNGEKLSAHSPRRSFIHEGIKRVDFRMCF